MNYCLQLCADCKIVLKVVGLNACKIVLKVVSSRILISYNEEAWNYFVAEKLQELTERERLLKAKIETIEHQMQGVRRRSSERGKILRPSGLYRANEATSFKQTNSIHCVCCKLQKTPAKVLLNKHNSLRIEFRFAVMK